MAAPFWSKLFTICHTAVCAAWYQICPCFGKSPEQQAAELKEADELLIIELRDSVNEWHDERIQLKRYHALQRRRLGRFVSEMNQARTAEETPAETPAEAPTEIPAETSADTQTETPADTPTETPAETSTENEPKIPRRCEHCCLEDPHLRVSRECISKGGCEA
ncbi:hypothetical protein F4804DRAFT_348701 [Jackrogersella minutella]|nr:hypothetical protein F4804DRAFT_348701 [Jackrogersella minutella]